jgi:hypothetical protein
MEVLSEQQQQEQKDVKEQLMGNTALVPAGGGDDGWNTEAASADSWFIQGSLLLYADWLWTIGSEKTQAEKGRRYAPAGVRSAWTFWQGGKPVRYVTAEPGRLLPSRESLGDHDESLWERDANDRPKDPWANARFVYLIDIQTAEALTFSTSSFGGRRCVEDLARAITIMRRQHPNAVPVVELDAAPMQTKFGRKSRPVFKIVTWRFPKQTTIEVEKPKAIEASAQSAPRDDMNDSIPW